jgi:hypothetical protein
MLRDVRAGDGIRTHDVQLGNAAVVSHLDEAVLGVTSEDGKLLAVSLPARPADAELARVVEAWPDLPPHIRAAVLALVGTAAK